MCHHCEHHEGIDCACAEKSMKSSCCCEGECCGDGSHFHRRYQTNDEQISILEGYLNEIKLEVQAVEERLAGLRGK
jgi:hypothetical protein